jgi:hypothetical protein
MITDLTDAEMAEIVGHVSNRDLINWRARGFLPSPRRGGLDYVAHVFVLRKLSYDWEMDLRLVADVAREVAPIIAKCLAGLTRPKLVAIGPAGKVSPLTSLSQFDDWMDVHVLNCAYAARWIKDRAADVVAKRSVRPQDS